MNHPTTAVARRDTAAPDRQSSAALAIRPGQATWDEFQVAALAQLGLADATDGDRAVFMHVCQRTGLDPFARQIYMIQRSEKKNERRGNAWVETWAVKWTIQTGIEGWRVIRGRAEKREGVRSKLGRAVWYDADGTEYKVWVRQDPPAACEITLTVRDAAGNETPYTSVLMFREYVQTKNERPVAQWATKPAHMLEKCTEADVYRKAFPQDFSGVELDDAMPPAEAPAAAAPAGRVTAAEITARRGAVAGHVIPGEPGPAPETAEGPGPTGAAPAAASASTAAPAPGRTAPPAGSAEPRPTGAAIGKLGQLLTQIIGNDPEDQAVYLEWMGGAPNLAGLSKTKVVTVTQHLTNMLAAAEGDREEAASRIWQAYKAAQQDQADSGQEIREAGDE